MYPIERELCLPEFSITPPEPTDGPAILQVHQKAFVDGYANDAEPGMGATSEALEKFVHGEFAERKGIYWDEQVRQRTGLYVARLCCNNKIVGVGQADIDTATTVAVRSLYVLPEYQNRGVGTALLKRLVRDYNQPIVRLAVTRWAPAAAFYLRRGFRPTGRPVSAPEPPKAYGIILEQIEMELHKTDLMG
jgi:GNAT superfamily N-acetyltransferase